MTQDHSEDLPSDVAPTEGATQEHEEVAVEQLTDTTAETNSLVDGKAETNRTSRPFAKSSGFAVAVFGLLLITAVNLPYQYQASNSTAFTGLSGLDLDSPRWNSPPRMAGWPRCYLIDDPVTGDREFSLIALITNLCILMIPVALTVLYFARRNKGSEERARGKIRISDLLVVTLVLAVPLSWYQRKISKSQKDRQAFSSTFGSQDLAARSSWCPSLIRHHLPSQIESLLGEWRGIRLENPSDAKVALAVSEPYLTSLRLGGGQYDLRLLDSLLGRPHLRDLRIAGRELDARTIQLIGQLKKIETLNLVRTNVSSESLQELDLPHLHSLSLIGTDLELSELGNPPWSQTIERLILPHPENLGPQNLVIQGWPKLKELTINAIEGPLNSQTIRVELSDLPELTKLSLDRFQKFDLDLSDLPKLETIESLSNDWQLRVPTGGSYPASTWVQDFHGENLPSLESLSFYSVDLKSFLIRGAPKIDSFGITVQQFTHGGRGSKFMPMNEEAVKAMLEGIGKSEGPAVVDLDAISLTGADLSPLAQNQQIQSLYLASTDTSLQEWKALEGMTWLKDLRLSGNSIASGDMQWALEHFPNLVSLECEPDDRAFRFSTDDATLELVGHKHLKSLSRGSPLSSGFIRQVKVVDMPQLELPLTLYAAERIEIRNAPRLQGLALHGPVPHVFEVDEFRDAEFFAVGGQGVTDQIVESISQCHQLKLLTLAHTELSEDTLSTLPLSSIEKLFLPGNNVTDAVVDRWPPLNQLTHLDLRGTKITGKSLPKLIASPSLRYLRLDGCRIDTESIKLLRKLRSVVDLSLAGIQVDLGTLTQLFNAQSLEMLDLSGVKLDKATIDQISKRAIGLQFLGLRDAQVDSKALQSLVKQHRQLTIDAGIEHFDTRTLIQLEGRMKSRGEFLRDRQMRQAMAKGNFAMADENLESLIDTDRFATINPMQDPNSPATPPATGWGNFFQSLLGNGGSRSTGENPSEDTDDSDTPSVEVEEK